MVESTLKNGWRSYRFDRMASMINDRIDNPEEAGVDRYVGLEHLDPDSLRIRRWGSPSDVTATKLLFRSGDVIFGRRRVYQRKLAVADFDGICSAHAMVLRAKPNVVLPEFLPFFMQSDMFMERAKEISVGSLSPTINWKSLAKEEFALPPPDEQRRISRMMTNHLHAFESIRAALERATQLREAMLLECFPPASAGMVSLEDLVRQGDLDFQTGPFGTVLSADEYRSVGWPVVNPSEMKGGEIHRDGAPCVSDETAVRLDRYRLRRGDILLARKGDFSKAVIAREHHEGWLAGSDTIRLRVMSEKFLPGYIYLALQAPSATRMLDSYSHGTVMPGLNEGMLGRLVLEPLNLEDQHEIVNRLSQVDSGILRLRQRVQQFRLMTGSLLDVVLRVSC